MDENDKTSLLQAVNGLVKAENGPQLYADMLTILESAVRIGLEFTGDRKFLNPLLALASSNREQFLKVISLVEAKRAEAGLAPLSAPPEGYNKTSYMREFMAQKRERERRAAEIENLMRGDRSPLKGRARLEFMTMQSARWKAQRDEMLASARQRQGKPLGKAEEAELIKQFWARVDRELDGLEELARDEIKKRQVAVR